MTLRLDELALTNPLRLDELALTSLLKFKSGKLQRSVENLKEINENRDIFDARLQSLFMKASPAINYMLLSPLEKSANPKLLIRAIRNLLWRAKDEKDVRDINFLLDAAECFTGPQKPTKFYL